MFTSEQVQQISATERQYNILRHVPPGVEPLAVHSGRIARVYQPNDELDRIASDILHQVRELLLSQSVAIRVLCPTAEIKAAVESRLNAHELARLTLEVGV